MLGVCVGVRDGDVPDESEAVSDAVGVGDDVDVGDGDGMICPPTKIPPW